MTHRRDDGGGVYRLPGSWNRCPPHVRQVALAWHPMRAADRNITLAALRDWARQHGRYPTQREWARTAPGRPSARTIDRRWGWQRMLAEVSGLGPDHARTLKTEHRRQKMLMALGAAYIELGRWPTGREWEHATTAHAARRTYVREFGSWADACQAAERARQLPLA